jgi:arylsulfatase A-like enzyme
MEWKIGMNIKTRSMNKLSINNFICIICFLILGCTPNSENNTIPNFLFILVDDLGCFDLSVTGSKYYETPNIDKLANNGVVFTNGYSTSAVCSPSRASLLTGKYTARHGITDWIGAKSGPDWRTKKRYSKLLPADYSRYLGHEHVTIPEALKAKGYSTFFAGKWHLGSEVDNSLPTNHGFDVNIGGYHLGWPDGGFFPPYKNPFLNEDESDQGLDLPMKLAKETSKFIKQNGETPFFAYLSFFAVHSPIQTTEEKWQKYRNKAEHMGIHETGFEMERVFPIRKYQDNPVYAGLIEHVDEAVAHVLQTLDDLNLDENTVIIFTSDNGGVASGDNYSTSNSPLRGGKGYQWEAGFRVPYFIHVPWLRNNGTKNNTVVTGADFYPTILELAGLEQSADDIIDGVSLVPLLKGEKIQPRTLYFHYPHYGNQGGEPNSIIRQGNWKLIHYWEDSRNELYDISEDIEEQNNVSEHYPEIVSSMNIKLMEWLVVQKAKYPKHDPEFNSNALNKELENYKNIRLPLLEKQRFNMLKKDWAPNENWWGSKIIMD